MTSQDRRYQDNGRYRQGDQSTPSSSDTARFPQSGKNANARNYPRPNASSTGVSKPIPRSASGAYDGAAQRQQREYSQTQDFSQSYDQSWNRAQAPAQGRTQASAQSRNYAQEPAQNRTQEPAQTREQQAAAPRSASGDRAPRMVIGSPKSQEVASYQEQSWEAWQARGANSSSNSEHWQNQKQELQTLHPSYVPASARLRTKPMKKRLQTWQIILIVVAVVVVLGGLVFGGITLINALNDDNETQIAAGQDVTVTIPEGAATRTIASILKEAGVISSSKEFLEYLEDNDLLTLLPPGTFEMKTGMSNEDAANTLLAGDSEPSYTLTVPEGKTYKQIASIVEEASGGLVTAQDFKDTIKNNFETYVQEYPFLEGAYRDSVEGFLFPDTYEVFESSSADTIIRMMLDQFTTVIGSINLGYAESKGMTIADVANIASLIEREAVQDDERTLVSAVIYNRLADGMKLQFCSTVNYVVGHSGAISEEEMATDSKYNTYVYEGLPAGPICSAGKASLEAAANPADVDLYYFKTDADFESGRNVFSKDGVTYNSAETYLKE